MSAVVHDHGHAHDDHGHGHHGPYGGIMRWITTTNHKDIGTLYLWFSFVMFSIGGLMAVGIRLELFSPGLQFLDPDRFNQLTTMHGLVMVFGAIMPAFVGFANWMIPLQVGASDMAFARMNNFSFWLLPPAAILLATSFFVPGGATAAGWTLYAPLSTQMGPGMDLGIFALHSLRLPTVLRHLSQAISQKGEQRGRKLYRRDDVPMLAITSPHPVRLQCDGDLIGERTCVKISSVRHALAVVG